jgi:hypothetical protein
VLVVLFGVLLPWTVRKNITCSESNYQPDNRTMMSTRGISIRSIWLGLVVISASWSGVCWRSQCCLSASWSLLIGSKDGSSSSDTLDSTFQRTCYGMWFADAASVAPVATSDEDGADATASDSSSSSGTKHEPGSSRSLQRNQQQQSSRAPTPGKGSPTVNEILLKAGRKGLGGGIPGAIAGVVQVMFLMWVRTVINYQSRYGTSFFKALHILYKEGGIRRFYRGVGFALVQAPLTRFVSTATNDGVLAFLASFPLTQHWGPGITTVFASIFVGMFRILLMPVVSCTVNLANLPFVWFSTPACVRE